MPDKILAEILIFAGTMATLGCITAVILTTIKYRRPALKSGSFDEIVQRLGRIEQAVDATAVEVERISEGQRFTTKLLVEKGHQPPAEGPRAKAITPH
jgi:hypothetical protein